MKKREETLRKIIQRENNNIDKLVTIPHVCNYKPITEGSKLLGPWLYCKCGSFKLEAKGI